MTHVLLPSPQMVAVRVTTCIAPSCGKPAAMGAFCETCAQAPAGKRGGWLSAHKRSCQRAGVASSKPLDASCIANRLWVGGAPPFDVDLPHFDVLVLCAAEIQPPREQVAFHGEVLRVGIPDGELNHSELLRTLGAGRKVGTHLVAGKTVLVTCAQGRNRSALVACLGLGLVTRLGADELVANVRSRRLHNCLTNEHFVTYLQRYIGQGRRAPLGALTGTAR